jgi:hypothetical protein
LEVVGDVVTDPCDELRTNIQLCDEEGCCQQAVVVLPNYSKCDEHDKDQKITELLQSREKRKKKSLTTAKKQVIL